MTKKILVWVKEIGGSIQLLPIEAASLDDASRILPEGVYTTFRTYGGGKVLGVSYHLERLRESAVLLGADVNLDELSLREIMRVAINDISFSEKRIRLQINLSQLPAGQIYIMAEQLRTPDAQDYHLGVSVTTRPLHRDNALAKSTQFIHTARSVRSEALGENNEVLMIGEKGDILEGLSSNFFSVLDGKVWTAEEGVLHGITRKVVLLACERCGIEVVRQPVHLKMLPMIPEAFITSASRGILPVIRINDQILGSGALGEVTKALMLAYEFVVQDRLEYV